MDSAQRFQKMPSALARTLSEQVQRAEYLWEVCPTEFHERLKRKRVPIYSPIFSGGPDDGLKWQIGIRLGPEETSVNGCHQNPSDSNNDHLKVFVALVSMRRQNSGANTGVETDVAVRCELKFRFANAKMNKSEAMEKAERITVGEQLEIKIDCVLQIYLNLRETASEVLNDYVATRQLQSLTTFMGSMLKDSSSADITLKVGKEVYPAHTCILSARSKVFATMLASNVEGAPAQKRTVVITDFEPQTVEAMLMYIYCGDISAAKDNPFDLLKIADRYELPELKEECGRFIVPSLTVANAAQAVICAYEHNLNTQMPEIRSFVNRNREAILNTDSFRMVLLRYPELIFDLYASQ